MQGKDFTVYRFLTASSLAILLEVLDFTLYGYTANILASRLLPQTQYSINYIWLIFACGLISRLAGALIFGHIADRFGTKLTLSVAIVLMGLSTAGIGCIPTYEQIGLIAPILLILLRCLQGFSFAPEYNSISNYLSFKQGFKNHYTLACSLTVTFGSLGLAAGGWMMTWLTKGSDLQSLSDWHWRLPYIVSGLLLGSLSFYLRMQMDNIKSKTQVTLPVASVIKKEPLKLITCVMLMGLVGILTYSIAGFITTYLQTNRGFSLHQALKMCSSQTWILACLTLIGAWFSDRFNRKLIIRLALLAMIIISPLSFYYIVYGNPLQVEWAMLGLIFLLGFISGPLPAFLSKTFAAEHRYTAASISYNYGMAIFGGATPLLMTKLVEIHPMLPGGALACMAGLVLILHLYLWPNNTRLYHRVLLQHAYR